MGNGWMVGAGIPSGWGPHLRSKAALRQAPRRHFCDPSLAVVCGSGYGYRRADGISVVPVGALGL